MKEQRDTDYQILRYAQYDKVGVQNDRGNVVRERSEREQGDRREQTERADREVSGSEPNAHRPP